MQRRTFVSDNDGSPTLWLSATPSAEALGLRPAPRPRLERGTYCLGGTFEVWPYGAGRGLTCRSAIGETAGYSLAWPRACSRWLPVRLPGFSLATLTSECSRPDAITDRESRRHRTGGPRLAGQPQRQRLQAGR